MDRKSWSIWVGMFFLKTLSLPSVYLGLTLITWEEFIAQTRNLDVALEDVQRFRLCSTDKMEYTVREQLAPKYLLSVAISFSGSKVI